MSLNSLKQFQFFENLPIKDPLLGTTTPLYSDPTLSAATLLDDHTLCMAVNSTSIKIVDFETSTTVHTFEAFDQGFEITHLQVITDTFLIVIAQKTGAPDLLRVYRLDKLPDDPRTYHSMVELKNGDNMAPISALSISVDMSCIVVGYTDGTVALIRGDLMRDRGSRQRIIYTDQGKEPITSVELTRDAGMVYVSTTSRIMMFNTLGKNKGVPDLLLNAHSGVNLGCAVFNPFSGEYICCHNDMIEFYRNDGERHTLAFEPTASIRRCFPVDSTRLLLIIGEKNSQVTASLEINEYSSTVINRIVILDVQNKIISLNFIISHGVMDIITRANTSSDGASRNSPLFLLTSNGVLYKIIEKGLWEQLDIIIKKELFPFALEVAKNHGVDPIKIQEIHRTYGDYLYKKGLKKEATEQFIQCLDVVETSEIVSKYAIEDVSNPNNLRNLADYIWSLIKKGIATPDHVTLLLIVLIKLKDNEGIKFFTEHFTRLGRYTEEPLAQDIDDETYFYNDKKLFDLRLILTLLEESNFKIEAYDLARKFAKDPVTIAELLLNVLNEPWSALNYIKSLAIDDTLRVLTALSKQLLESLPNDTNALLIEVFTGRYTPTIYKPEVGNEGLPEQAKDFKKIFYSYSAFMNYMNEAIGSSRKQPEPASQEVAVRAKPTYHPPKPSIVFSSFLSKPFQFVVFLEACLDSYQRYEGLLEDKQTILITLYDLYLTLANEDVPERQMDWKKKAVKVLKESERISGKLETTTDSSKGVTTGSVGSRTYDNSLMMLISHMNRVDMFLSYDEESDEFGGGNVLGGNTETMWLNNFRSLTLTEEASVCMKLYEKYQTDDPNFHRMALQYFVSSEHVLNDIGGETVLKEKVIDKIVAKNILPILEIVQILSSTDVVTYGVVQDILLKHVEESEAEIQKNMKLVHSYEDELKQKKQKLYELLDTKDPISIRIKNQLCYMCETPIELPMVYFKCGHIYHQRCLNEENSTETNRRQYTCPKCIVELETSNRLFELQHEVSSKYEMFKLALDNEDINGDRFKVVTEFIGKGGLEQGHVTYLEK